MPKEIPPVTFPYHARHIPNALCAFHARYTWHSMEDCLVFKAKVNELIDQKILSFSEEQPNVKTNPLFVHNRPVVNVIEEEECTKLVRNVSKGKTYMEVFVKKLQEHGFLEGLHDSCMVYEAKPDECGELKSCV